jgi:carboxylate-amine ligase
VSESAPIAALIQALVRLEATEGHAPPALVGAQEVLEENSFIAARDGMDARLIDIPTASQVPVREQLEAVLSACEPHADDLGSRAELDELHTLMQAPGAVRQRATVGEHGLTGLVGWLASSFLEPGGELTPDRPGRAATGDSRARGSP